MATKNYHLSNDFNETVHPVFSLDISTEKTSLVDGIFSRVCANVRILNDFKALSAGDHYDTVEIRHLEDEGVIFGTMIVCKSIIEPNIDKIISLSGAWSLWDVGLEPELPFEEP